MLIITEGIEDYMLPCLNKKILGFECMGCGIQRSIALILNGQFIDAFYMYPAIYTLIGFFGFLIINSFKNFKNSNKIIFILAISNVIIIVGSYLIKLYLKQT
ncbi:DUF2752 domain-containing protein [Winogradskyella endarachnes]|uniref:DUF2752 domain-containing protein n=1 Tax=Winogradskyella endarachnes TaxID=2681965 RepID=A0A6L6U5I3_9FLAO|nr:DUF2752 domain-containing protein [Winogradskyella endarachnes]MUU77431.1 DUF2752 domain-containing protein [Winogradskyella endarachnes]